MRAVHDAALPAYLNDRDAWESARKKVLGSSRPRSEKRAALDAIGPEPAAPLHPMLTAQEPTLEGLHKLLAIGQPSLGVFSAEGGQFTGGHGMSDDAKLRTAAGFSGLWDGTPIQRVRAGDGASVLPGRRVCLHLMAQPDVCGAFLGDRVLADQGLLSRVLVTAPASTMGTRQWRDPPASARAALAAYADLLRGLLSAPQPLAPGKPNELQPRALPVLADARALWISYADSVEMRLREGGEYESIRGLAGKLPEHAARIAAVLTLAGDLGAARVPAERLADGIKLAEHYAGEAQRLHDSGAGDPTLRLAQRALAWCQSQPGRMVALADLYQCGPRGIRDAAAARRIMDILTDHGWLAPMAGVAEVAGRFRREVWRVREDVR
jgi:hypothetical protein